MKPHILLFLSIIFVLPVHSQENPKPVNCLGLTVEYGIGAVALTDQYISKERYTGTIPYFFAGYGRMNDTKGFMVGFMYQHDDELENYNILADLKRTSLNFDQYFRLKEFQLFNKPATWYLGPSVEYFEYELTNRFSSTHKVFSELIMATAGINTLLDWQFGGKFNALFFFRTNVIGVSSKNHDEYRYPDKNSVLQTPLTANNIYADLRVDYRFIKRLSVGLKGIAQYTRSTGWDDSRTFINSISGNVTIHF